MEKFNFLIDFNENITSRLKLNTLEGISFNDLLNSPSELNLSPKNFNSLKEFINNLNNLLDVFLSIFNKPYIQTITEEVILRSELASNITSEGFRKTTLDSSLWKKKRSGYSPELVYSIEYEDTISNYENYFIIYVFKKIIDLVSTFKEFNLNYTNSLRSFYGTNEASLSELSIYSSINKNKDQLSKYIFLTGSNNENYQALSEIHTKIKHLKLHKFYKLLKNSKFSLPVKLTNTLLHDNRYNRVYRFFKDNLLFNDISNSYDNLFFNYSLIRLLNYLSLNRKVQELKIPLIKLDDNKLLALEKEVTFKFNKFSYKLSLDPLHLGFILKTTYYKVETKTFIKVFYSYNDNDSLLNHEYIRDFDNSFIITNNNLSKTFNNIFELNYEKELFNDLGLENILLSTQIVLPLTSNTLIKCPYCGETKLINNLNSYHCLKCNNEFLTLNINHKIHLWLKSLYRGE